jgi:WD40 repeat protein
VAVTPEGRRAISGSEDATVRVWDLEAGQCLATFEGHTGGVNNVTVLPDGRRAISGSDDKTVRVWDLETGQCLTTLKGHTIDVQICLWKSRQPV